MKVACISVNGYPTCTRHAMAWAAPEAEENTHCARETAGRPAPDQTGLGGRTERGLRLRPKGARSRPPPAELLISGSPGLERVIRKVFAGEIWDFLDICQ